jgi:exonuclease VII small subunit
MTLRQEVAGDFKEAADLIITEMRARFAEVNERLDRIQATLESQGEELARQVAILEACSKKLEARHGQ